MFRGVTYVHLVVSYSMAIKWLGRSFDLRIFPNQRFFELALEQLMISTDYRNKMDRFRISGVLAKTQTDIDLFFAGYLSAPLGLMFLVTGTERVKGKSGNAGSMEDVDGDGDLDMVVQIVDEGTFVIGDSTATLTAFTYGGVQVFGTDTIRIVPAN